MNETKHRCCIALAWVSAAAVVSLTALLVVIARPADDTDAKRLQQLKDARQEIMRGQEVK